MDEPRVCVVGAGRHSTRRIYPYLGAAGARLVGVCDVDAEKAERNARLFGGTPYTDMDAMLDEQRPDGVIICIGPAQHAELAVQVLRRGIPVYTEKPPAQDAASALEVARAGRRAGVLCMTAFKKRYAVAYVRAKRWLEQFRPDDLYSISADYASAQYDNRSAHAFLHDFAIHMIDLVGYLFGEADQVFCHARGRDAYAVTIRFANGAVGSLNLNCGRCFEVPTEEVEITVRGGNFMSIHNSSCWRICEKGKPTEWREPPTFISAGDSGRDTGHLSELEHFVAALREGSTASPSEIYESYKSMVLYEAIRDSAETGRPVSVSYATLDAWD